MPVKVKTASKNWKVVSVKTNGRQELIKAQQKVSPGHINSRKTINAHIAKVIAPDKPKMGRPSLKTPQLLQEICKRIMSGQNIVEVCEADDMPNRDSVHTWLAQDANFSDDYVRACRIRRELKFYAMEDTARKEEDVNRARLINDTIKWQLSKEEPTKYGDKLDVTSDGKALPAPLLQSLTLNMQKLTDLPEIPQNKLIDSIE